MFKRLLSLLVAYSLLLTTATAPLLAQEEIPEPFCGNLQPNDCELLRTAVGNMLALESYHTSIAYSLILHGIPEMPVQHAETVLHVEGDYAFDNAARAAAYTLALISREEPLAAVAAIGQDPNLLIDLYRGTTADLFLTLELTAEWMTWLRDDTAVAWPSSTTVEVRLVDGVLYFDLRELKAFVPDMADAPDWAAIALVQALEQLAADGTFGEIAGDVAMSSTGRSVTGLDPMMLNLITSLRGAFGQPQLLEEFMTIRRRNDVELAGEDGSQRTQQNDTTRAFFETEFDVLDFIFSDEFRTLLQQVFEIASTTDDAFIAPEEATQAADLFWIVAPALFRDLEIGGSTTIGLESNHEVAATSRFHWDLTTLIQVIQQFGEFELENVAEEVYLAFLVDTQNRAFNETVTVTAPDDAEILPFDNLGSSFRRPLMIDPAPPVEVEEPTSKTIAHYEAGVILYEQGQWEEAIDELGQAIVRYPDYAEAYYQRGLVYVNTNSIDAARQDFLQANELDPTLRGPYFELGRLADKEQLWDESVVHYSDAIAIDEQYAAAYYNRGYAYRQLGDPGAAIADFTSTIELDPDDRFAYAQRADIQVILGEYEAAIADADRAIEIYSGYDWAFAVRGNAYYQLGDYEAAIADFTEAITITPDYEWAYAQRANAYVLLEEFDAAIEDASVVIDFNPNYTFAYAVRGNAYRQSGQDEAALADFTEAIALESNYAYAYFSRGLIYQNQGNYESARAEYESNACYRCNLSGCILEPRLCPIRIR